MFFAKLMAFVDLFRKGSAVADKAAWKNGQIAANAVGGVILSASYLANAFGYPVPIPEDAAVAIGAGIIAGVNVLLTAATSEHVGILPQVKE